MVSGFKISDFLSNNIEFCTQKILKNIILNAMLYKRDVYLKNKLTMVKYSKKAQEKIADVMQEFKDEKLKTSAGDKVTDRKQAVAIGISEAKQAGLKVPEQEGEGKEKSKKKTSSESKK